MKNRWGDNVEFDFIILDYFFSPEGWARTRWTDAFYEKTLPMLVNDDILKPNGTIYLPNLECVEDLLLEYDSVLSKYYYWEHVSRPKENPLFRATSKVDKELLQCPDRLTNDTQMKPLANYSETPFIALKRIHRSYEKRNAKGEIIRKAASRYNEIITVTPNRKSEVSTSSDEEERVTGDRRKKRRMDDLSSYLSGC